MRKRKYYLYLTKVEHRFIIQFLPEYHNKLISQGKYTDGVDELIIKYIKWQQAREVTLVPVAIC